MADGIACFACGHEWPSAGAASPSPATSAAKAPSPAAHVAAPAAPPAAPDIEDIDLGLDVDPAPPAASLSLLGGGESPFVTPAPSSAASPSASNPFAIPRPVTGTFPNPGLAPDLSNLAAEVEATAPDRLDDDVLAGAFLAGASGAPAAPPPARSSAPPNPFATPAPGTRPGNPFASAPGSFGAAPAPAAADGFNPFDGDAAPSKLPPPPPLDLEIDAEPEGEDVSWEDLDKPPAPPAGGLLADGEASFDDIELDDEAEEPTVDTAHSPAYLAKKASEEPLSERLILLAAELDADGRYDDAALLHEAARALAAHKA